MKEILAATAVLGSFASLWFATYYTMKASEPSPGKRHSIAGVIALIGGVLLAWLVSPSDGSAEMGWGWVLLALVISIFLVRVAALTPESLREVLAREQPSAGAHAPQTRAIRNGWRIADIQFTYQSAKGEITTRTVTVHSVSATHIKGECHDKHAERTFRVDCVIGDVLDLDTGELLAAKKWVRNYS